jgi:pimeloyl-ACP methyl ester carboxylesterase
MAERKPIPPPTFDVVVPPNLTLPAEDKPRRYFEGASEHPFRPEATAFDLVNAWWLAEAALLAYAEPDEARPRYLDGGFRAEFFPGSAQGTQAYVLVRDEFCVVAFRGTQLPKNAVGSGPDAILAAFTELFKDSMADEHIRLVPFPNGGRVHRGFNDALEAIREKLERRLGELQQERPSRPFFFTGHSLGAALATLAAARFGSVRGLYTFGSPLVGDAAFKDGFRIKSAFRIVHHNDIVTRVPPPLPQVLAAIGLDSYVHVGTLEYIDQDGRIAAGPPPRNGLGDAVAAEITAFVKKAGRLSGFHLDIPFDRLTDHAPLYYALHLWNAAFA